MGNGSGKSRYEIGRQDLKQVLAAEYSEVFADRADKPPAEGNLEALYDYTHQLEPDAALTGLCISGGGIRSATLGLGVLQALAGKGLLGQFDYLSTVSGGGYIGSWLKAWQKNNAASFEHCLENCAPEDPSSPEPPPVRHLRSYSSYLTPEMGLFSGDTWTLAAIYLRNMLLNWFVLLPVLCAVILLPWMAAGLLDVLRDSEWLAHSVLAIGFLCGAIGLGGVVYFLPSLQSDEPPNHEKRTGVAWVYTVPLLASVVMMSFAWFHEQRHLQGEPWVRGAVLVGATLGFQLAGWLAGLTRRFETFRVKLLAGTLISGVVAGLLLWAFDTFWVANYGTDSVAFLTVVVPVVILIQLVSGAILVGIYSSPGPGDTSDRFEDDREWWARSGGIFLIAAAAWLAFMTMVLYLPQWFLGIGEQWRGWMAGTGITASGLVTAAVAWWTKPVKGEKGDWKKVSMWLQQAAEKLLGPVFLIGLVMLVSLGVGKALVWPAGMGARQFVDALERAPFWTLTLACLILVAFGFASGYFVSANRFSLASMYRNRLIRAYLGAARNRQPDLFTGFDPNDNFLMADLPATRPFHIVNMALNITSGKRLAWQQRKASSFTATRFHCGSAVLDDGKGAYWRSESYTDAGGLSLGTAVALSGAAASPNMGYHSSKILTLILSLFNIRLGMWLPNPVSEDPYHVGKSDPAFPYMIVTEALGMADDTHPWIYLSDGGHFENLGLYELVRRRCRYIVVSDGSADPKYCFEDLANAILKIRVDLGVPITIDGDLRMAREGMDLKHCGSLTVHYDFVDGPQAKPGTIFYIKGVLTGDEEKDVSHYASLNPDFPQQPTSDQFFDEVQFEAYRKLGQHTLEKALAGFPGGTVADAIIYAQRRYLDVGERGAAA